MTQVTDVGPIRDEAALIDAATQLLEAVRQLEANVGGAFYRQLVLDCVTPLDLSKGQPFRVTLGDEVTLYADQSENVRRKRPNVEPALAPGSRPSERELAAAARWALTKFVAATSKGHVKAVVDGGAVRVEATDAYGLALMRIADGLTQGQTVSLAMRRRCVRCGKEITARRSTKRYCSNACQQAMTRARRRAREEESR